MKKMIYCPRCAQKLVTIRKNDHEYLACESENCDYIFWDNPVPVVAALVEHEGQVLLARNKEWPEKMFGLVTGFLEKKETTEQAVLREVEEELGLRGEVAGLIGLYPFYERNELLIVYHVRTEGLVSIGEELAEVRMVPPEKLKPWAFGTGYAVQDWLDRRK